MVYFPVPDHEKWRCDIILEMLNIRKKSLVLEKFNEDENTTIFVPLEGPSKVVELVFPLGSQVFFSTEQPYSIMSF
jgi:hypothetical protein